MDVGWEEGERSVANVALTNAAAAKQCTPRPYGTRAPGSAQSTGALCYEDQNDRGWAGGGKRNQVGNVSGEVDDISRTVKVRQPAGSTELARQRQ